MGIEYERQELRALMLRPIRHLPSYSADYAVTCRVGKAVSAHVTGPWHQLSQSNLEAALRERRVPFVYKCPRTGHAVEAMVDQIMIGPDTICVPMDCPICNTSHIVNLGEEIAPAANISGLPLN